MFTDPHQKVNAHHLRREAFLYVRQSTLRQLVENTESTQRQYSLRDRAVALGWPIERVHTIDDDQGRSGAHAENRDGFQHLVSEVALGHAGIVLGLEVSRLARNSADWQRLLELCALSRCLIGDDEGVYDPAHFNDRLLLGLKGTMSEVELHMLRTRLIGGQRNKARRGALEVPLPIGLVYNAIGAVILDPDSRIQACLRALFDTFRERGSASAVVDRFRQTGQTFPRRLHRGVGKGEVIWAALEQCRVTQILHNPRYAGAFVYGRHRTVRKPNSKSASIILGRKDWQVFIPNAHPGYLSWEEFERNEATLEQNLAASYLADRTHWPYESLALLQGRVLCGVCGTRMQIGHDRRPAEIVTYYTCQAASTRRPNKPCQWVRAADVDAAIGKLLLQTVNSTTLQTAITIQSQLTARLDQAQARRRQQLERVRHHAELKRRQFLQCDPDHRLVADALEASWNEQLRELDALQQAHERERLADRGRLDEETRARLVSLAEDFPRVWTDPHTDAGERKRLLALLIEDITLTKADTITVRVRFRGGRTTSLILPLPAPGPRVRKTSPEVLRQLEQLLETCSDREAATRLNALGHRDWQRQRFTAKKVWGVREHCGLKSHFERLRARGCLTAREMARQLGLCVETVYIMGRNGILPRQYYGNKHRCLYEPLNGAVYRRGRGGRYRSRPAQFIAAGEVMHVD
jgi:DNA invertase Pin-like site-specific DNA recombinase